MEFQPYERTAEGEVYFKEVAPDIITLDELCSFNGGSITGDIKEKTKMKVDKEFHVQEERLEGTACSRRL